LTCLVAELKHSLLALESFLTFVFHDWLFNYQGIMGISNRKWGQNLALIHEIKWISDALLMYLTTHKSTCSNSGIVATATVFLCHAVWIWFLCDLWYVNLRNYRFFKNC
jgi:hypothetical protein